MPGVSAILSSAPCHLGLDAGGTQTRWALADAAGRLHAEGTAPPLSGLMLLDDVGRAALRAALDALAAALPPGLALRRAWAGITGVDATLAPALAQALAAALRLGAAQVHVVSDIDLACRAAFAPGEGVLVYAGTGSVAAHRAADGRLHRAGGRGAVIDDAGGGHWLAREALCRVWRLEDAAPGQGLATPLGRALARAVGGADWAATRNFVYGASRGELGTLALAVAEAAREGDATARALLAQAGAELARLAQALHTRLGAALPVALAGRVWALHPAIEAAFRAALQASAPGVPVRPLSEPAHVAAARLAAAQEAAP
ncbi:MAG: ATPase [Ideonella sp. WA131b]|jgi:N-acetylglucosamine kinase-like BadF-type ATPase|nr:ATPase [Ideonella sp. WA131b]